MNLITSEGYQMIDTDKHPLHRFAPGQIDGPHKAKRRPLLESAAIAVIYLASVAIAAFLIGWGYEELSRVDWSQLYVSKS
jgi:hypothetical protein